MSGSTIGEVVDTAEALIDAGDQGDAQALLTRFLLACGPASTDQEAVGIAKATGMLIDLDVGLLPEAAIDAHLERMYRLCGPFHGNEAATARAEAELVRFEWIHGHDDPDPVVLVDVLRGASEFAARGLGSEHLGVRRAAAEAAITGQMIREWLNQDAASIAVELESLALGLTAEVDIRMRHIRINALFTAARLRLEHGNDVSHVDYLLRAVISEGSGCAPARRFYYSATLTLADLALDAGAAPAAALAEATAALHDGHADDWQDATLRCQHLERLLDRIPAAESGQMAAAEWARLIERYSSNADPQVRATVLAHVLGRGGDVSDLTATDLQILQLADAASLSDTHPGTAAARFRVAAQIVEVLGYPDPGSATSASAPRRDPALAVRLSEDLEHRFPDAAADPELAATMARLLVDRALRLSDLGHGEQALAVLAGVRSTFSNAPANNLRHVFAQADYWRGRFLREAGHHAQASSAVDSVVAEFGQDPDPDVRVWAANALFSASRDPELAPSDADAMQARFAEAFGNDADPRIRRRDASRRLNQAVRAHEQGATKQAIHVLEELIARHAADADADTADTVRIARQNLNVLSLTAAEEKTPRSEAQAQYGVLSGQLHEADGIHASGRPAEAVQIWRELAHTAHGSSDPNIAVIGLAALDMWGGHLNDTQQWVELLDVARRAMVVREQLDFRAERMRARAYLRFGIAQGRVGDPLAAIAAYEALDAVAASTTDDEVMTTRQQAVYNRAVLIDDLGDAQGAIAAYDHVLAVHSSSGDSQSRRLRRTKALRNKAQLLNDLNRIPEAASAHRSILDIASGNPDPELCQRARLSAFALAECLTRLGDHGAAAQTYAWVRSCTNFGFTESEYRSAARAQKTAERQARRAR